MLNMQTKEIRREKKKNNKNNNQRVDALSSTEVKPAHLFIGCMTVLANRKFVIGL